MIRMMAPPCSDLSVFHVASTLCTEKLFPTNLQHSPFMNNSEPFSKPFGQAFDGLHPNSKGLQPTSDGLEFQPTSDDLQTTERC